MNKKAKNLINICKKNKLKLSLAESCTGGMICSSLVSIPSSSLVFQCGIVSYSNSSKNKILKVPNSVLNKYGAVSKITAELMVRGLYNLSKADLCMGITGIAGPSGGTKKKPVGLVYHSFLLKNTKLIVKKKIHLGTRSLIRKKSTDFCLEQAYNIIKLSV